MTAVLVVRGTAPQAEWLEARRKGITASEISVVMGLSPWDSPYALYHRKTGDLPAQDDTLAMALGRHLESFVAEQFGQRHPFGQAGDGRQLFAHPGRPWQLATPDRLLTDPGRLPRPPYPDTAIAVLECKTSSGYDGWGEDGSDVIPVHYRCQVLWQMDVLGVPAGFVACLFLHSRQLRVYELTMDDQARADLDLMEREARRFLMRIDEKNPPEIDWRPATSDALKRLHPSAGDRDVIIGGQLAQRYRAACARVKAAEQKKRLYENRVRGLLGTGRRAVLSDGEPVARRDVYDLPEKIITRKACTVDRMVAVTPREKSTP